MAESDIQPHRFLGGTEMEYGIMIHQAREDHYALGYPGAASGTAGELRPPLAPIERPMKNDEVREVIEADLPYVLRGPNHQSEFNGHIHGYATNGARIYQDVGDKLEYSTPECATYADAVHASIAGEHVIVNSLQRFLKRHELQDGERLLNGVLLGRVVDAAGNTWGAHESYMISREAFPRSDNSADTWPLFGHPLIKAALAHLATRTIFTGAGIFTYSPAGYPIEYERAQKIPSLTKDLGLSTTNEKALLHLRDEALADTDRYARLHITSGDYNLSPWAHWMRLGTTAIVAYLAEVEVLDAQGLLKGIEVPKGAAHRIAKAISKNENYEFETPLSGATRAVDVQDALCKEAEEFDAAYPELLTDEDRLILEHWRWAIDAMRTDPSQLNLAVDWRKRRELLLRYRERNPQAPLDKVRQLEQQWDNLNEGIGVRLRHLTLMPDYDPEQIARFEHTPPNTRAALRGKILRLHKPYEREIAKAGWERLEVAVHRGEFAGTYKFDLRTGLFRTDDEQLQQIAG